MDNTTVEAGIKTLSSSMVADIKFLLNQYSVFEIAVDKNRNISLGYIKDGLRNYRIFIPENH